MVYINTEGGGSFSFTPASSAFFAVKETGLIMEEVCSNCEHFTLVTTMVSPYIWGDCRKPVNGTEQITGQREAVFKWADKTCTDFEPKQQAE